MGTRCWENVHSEFVSIASAPRTISAEQSVPKQKQHTHCYVETSSPPFELSQKSSQHKSPTQHCSLFNVFPIDSEPFSSPPMTSSYFSFSSSSKKPTPFFCSLPWHVPPNQTKDQLTPERSPLHPWLPQTFRYPLHFSVHSHGMFLPIRRCRNH